MTILHFTSTYNVIHEHLMLQMVIVIHLAIEQNKILISHSDISDSRIAEHTDEL